MAVSRAGSSLVTKLERHFSLFQIAGRKSIGSAVGRTVDCDRIILLAGYLDGRSRAGQDGVLAGC